MQKKLLVVEDEKPWGPGFVDPRRGEPVLGKAEEQPSRPLTRAERRRLQRGASDARGVVGCKFCKSTKGTYTKAGNAFRCQTAGCRGNVNVQS